MSELTTLIDVFMEHASSCVESIELPSTETELQQISKAITLLGQDVITLGDKANTIIEQDRQVIPQEDLLVWPLMYEWMDDLKYYVVLWRDTLFQYQKGLILLQDDKVVADDIGELHINSVEHLREATSSLHSSRPDKNISGLDNNKIGEWQLLANPWEAYKRQFQSLIEQSSSIIIDYTRLNGVVTKTSELSQVATSQSNILKDELQGISQLIQSTKAYISEHKADPKKISVHLEFLEQEIKTSQSLEKYQVSIEELLSSINEVVRVPISIEGGPISYQEFNFGKQIRQWLDTEVQPGLHDMADLVDQVSNSLKMALINIRNRAIIITKEGQTLKEEVLKTELHQPLLLLENKIDEWDAILSQLDYVITTRIDKSLNVAKIYQGQEEYLPVPLQSTLTQFKLDQNELYVKLSVWFRRQSERFKSIKNIVIREESLSDSDKIVRYVRSRTVHDDRHQYDSLFKAQGYIGESFCVGRTHELQEIEASINAWHEGYRGAAVITGRRHSGKTLFGEWVSHRYFPTETINLRADNMLDVNGRQLSVKYDLTEALEFIKKHSINKRYLIWIDDIESWESTEHTASHNIRALIKYMDGLSHRLYFMVSMGPWTMYHWESIHGIKSAFQTTINLRTLTDKEAREAILIRHGATHKRLVSEETGENLNSSKFGNMVQQVHRLSNGVIGDTLLLWANGTTIEEEDVVIFHEPASFALPDFIEPDTAILLRIILYRRSCTDYELRKFFGTAYKQRYSAILQRHVAMGIIHRRVDDRLEIAEGVVNDVANLLEDHSYITINKEQ